MLLVDELRYKQMSVGFVLALYFFVFLLSLLLLCWRQVPRGAVAAGDSGLQRLGSVVLAAIETSLFSASCWSSTFYRHRRDERRKAEPELLVRSPTQKRVGTRTSGQT